MIHKKLLTIQSKLNAPKNQKNKFGGYNYRSCEDILSAVKPLLDKEKAIILLDDEIVQIGERYYIKATASLVDVEGEELSLTNRISVTAYAREPLNKKGMDEPQITGTASSYARKYALNGLLAIDDNKDPDSNEYQRQTREQTQAPRKMSLKATKEQKSRLNKAFKEGIIIESDFEPYKERYKVSSFAELTEDRAEKFLRKYGV